MDIQCLVQFRQEHPKRVKQDAEGCVSVDLDSIGFKPTRNTFALRVTGDSKIGRCILGVQNGF